MCLGDKVRKNSLENELDHHMDPVAQKAQGDNATRTLQVIKRRGEGRQGAFEERKPRVGAILEVGP